MDGNVTFSVLILSIISILFLSSCVNLDVIVQVSVIFWLSIFCVSARLGGSS